jgi:hypothetical protein
MAQEVIRTKWLEKCLQRKTSGRGFAQAEESSQCLLILLVSAVLFEVVECVPIDECSPHQ